MKTLQTVLWVGSFLISSVVFATDFSGHWMGKGMMSDTVHHQTACSSVDIQIEQTADLIRVSRYHARCGQLDSDWGPYVMDLKGQDVYDQGEKIGEIQGDILKTLSTDQGVDYAFNLRLSKNADGQRTLESYYGVRNLVGAIVIEGNLASQGP